MTAAKNQIYYTYLPKLGEDDQVESEAIIHTKGNDSNLERDDSTHNDDKSDTIIMDADGNYYYQLSENIVKVEPLTKATEIPTKKVAAGDVPSSKRNNIAQPPTEDLKRPKVEFSPNIKRKSEQKEKITDETISSEFSTQEEVYEFDKYEQNSVDPVKISDPNYESEGVIKKASGNDVANFTCMICSYQTYKKTLLSRHLKTHSDERPYKCCVCERGFKTNAALSNHRNTHLGYKPHGCSSCDMAFTTSGELMRHVRYRHTHIKPHKCTECDYSSVEMSKLRRHMRCHTGERPYQCPHCTYASPDTFKLKRHMRIHTGEKPYECDICHARFTQSNSLKHHRLIHSVNEKPVFQCHLCPTTCGRKTDLRLHIKKLHSSDQPIPCKRCGKELPDRYSYKMHIKTHEGEKCYRCEYCPYASISKRHLESHVFIHLNAKPFVCEVCESSFRQKPLLTRHMKIYHSSNYEPPQPRKKDHKCPHCGKMFAFNGNLMRHMEVHDPTSRMFEEKKTLKMGRMKRVRPDGSVVTITPSNNLSKLFDGSEEIFYEETEEHQAEDEGEFQKEYEVNEAYNEHNIQYVYEDYEADEYEEQDEEQSEQLQDKSKNSKNLINVKEEQIEAIDIAQATLRNSVNGKAEGNNDSEIMSLEIQDDQGFMVIEVLPDDDEEQQQEQEEMQQLQIQTVKHTIINKKANKPIIKKSQNNSQLLISDCFGFEVNAEDEEDEETKGAIKLLEMIKQE